VASSTARFFRRFVAGFGLRLSSFIFAWGFGGIRNSVPINRFVFSILSWSSRVMTDTDPKRLEIAAETANLHFQRALAIDAYASVEQSLCRLLAVLLNIDWQEAAIVFYKVQNSRARNTMFSELVEKKYGDKYEIYWHGKPNIPNRKQTGMYNLLRSLDDDRNQIVHWHIGQKMNEEERGRPGLIKASRSSIDHTRNRKELVDCSQARGFPRKGRIHFPFAEFIRQCRRDRGG
jgi:hypothetical protein